MIGTRFLANNPICAYKHESVSKLSIWELYRIFRKRLRNSIIKKFVAGQRKVFARLFAMFLRRTDRK